MCGMDAFFTRKLDLGYGRIDFLGSCVVEGAAVYFLRTSDRDMALVASRLSPGTKAFRKGQKLAFEYRLSPGGEPSAVEAAQLDRFATMLLRREDTIAETLEAGHPEADLPEVVSSTSADSATSFKLRLGEQKKTVTLHVGAKETFPLSLFRWSALLETGEQELQQSESGRIQHFFLWVVSRHMLGQPVFGGKGHRESTSNATFLYFDLKRPYINQVTCKEMDFDRGDSLVVSIEVPSPCDNRCIFCAPADLLEDEELVSFDEVMAEARNILGQLSPRLREAGRVDVALSGRDALNSEAILPLLKLIRGEGKINRITVVSPGRRLREADFVLKLKQHSLDSVNLTILGPDSATHDLVAGRDGAFSDLLASVRNLESTGIAWELNTVVVNQNVDRLGETLRKAMELGSKVRLYAYVSEPFVPLSRAKKCAPRYSEIAAALERDRQACLDSLVTVHYIPRCVLPEWARSFSGHSSQSFPDAPEEPPQPCAGCSAYLKSCGSLGTHYIELYGIDELLPFR